ncbi:UNKNOWN [Stylonychia lemnae]|uniref:Uncharacterized protein n=1 Tax=Stylonychia lemnae TaxID=5949 RepID=A0A078B3T6_STYLE|nr:UNKNOWN [Stylonychia lemnae]|eukprot:CDW88173.1 UNKNOWN [Stylonychia lemnae]
MIPSWYNHYQQYILCGKANSEGKTNGLSKIEEQGLMKESYEQRELPILLFEDSTVKRTLQKRIVCSRWNSLTDQTFEVNPSIPQIKSHDIQQSCLK